MITTRSLSDVSRVGGWTFAALVETTLSARAGPDRVAGHGAKGPRALLIGRRDGVFAQAPSGDTLTAEEIEALLPGAWAAFAAIAAADDISDHEEKEEEETP
jgi:hypothetical protein